MCRLIDRWYSSCYHQRITIYIINMSDKTLDTIAPVDSLEMQAEKQAIRMATKRGAMSAWDRYYQSMRAWSRILDESSSEDISIEDELTVEAIKL